MLHLKKDLDKKKLYDFIRMLDAEGYPKAFIDCGDLKIKFSKAIYECRELTAEVTIEK